MIKPYKINLIILTLLFLGFLTAQAQTTRYVAVDAADGGTGTSWADAYKDLQTAIDASMAGDQIFVKKGHYLLTASIVMKEGVKIYGSFAGGESDLSGRIFGTTTADSTVLDGQGSSGHVVFHNGESDPLTAEAVLDGFVITGGNSDGTTGYNEHGGGIQLRSDSPILQNLIIRNNRSGQDGGGLAIVGGGPIIRNVIFVNNQASRVGGGFWVNKAEPTFENVIVKGNIAYSDGGGICFRNGSSGTLTNVLITGNSASGSGGGFCFLGNSDAPILTNVTIAGNFASGAGGAINSSSSSNNPTFRNCLVLGNNSGIGGNGLSIANFSNSLVQGEAGGENGNLDGSTITAAEVFFNPAAAESNAPTIAGDFRLLKTDTGNPAVDAGSNTFFEAGQTPDLSHITTDLAGLPRIKDDSDDGTDNSIIDMGAYEGAIEKPNSLPMVSNVEIDGTITPDVELTGKYDFSDADNDADASTYAWYIADDDQGANAVQIEEATNKTYTIQKEEYQGKYIAFEVTPSDGEDVVDAVQSAWYKINTLPVVSNVIVASGTGNFTLGAELTGEYSFSDADNDADASTYAWYIADDDQGANAVQIEEAASKTYTIQKEEYQGKYIAFAVTPNDGKGTRDSEFSAWYNINTPPVVSNVMVTSSTGKFEAGAVLTGDYQFEDAEDDADASVFSWVHADKADPAPEEIMATGNDTKEYTIMEADRGKYIAFAVYPSDGKSLSSEPVLSSWMKVNTPPTASEVGITGILKAGETVQGAYGYADADNNPEDTDQSIYAWYLAEDGQGAGAMKVSASIGYEVKEADEGKYLAFEVAPSDGVEPGEAVKSAWRLISIPDPNNTAPTASEVMIAGTPEISEQLTGTHEFEDADGDEEGASAYAWYLADDMEGLNSAAIAGIISNTYTLTSSEQGKYIRFEVTPRDEQGKYGEAVQSDWYGPILGKTMLSFASDAVTKTYGDADFTAEASSNSDAVITYSSGDENIATVNESGEVHIVGVGETHIQASQAANGKWTAAEKTYQLSVAQKTLTVAATGTISKTYDGNAEASLTAVTYTLEGKVGDDDVAVKSAEASGAYNNKNVGTGKEVTISDLALEGADHGNYTLASETVKTTGEITAKTLNITVEAVTGAISKTYDGNTNADLSAATFNLEGEVEGDQVSVNRTAATGMYANKNVGTAKAVTINDLSLDGADKGNYTLASTTAETTGDILAKSVSITIGTTTGAISKTYDGSTAATLTPEVTYTLDGKVGTDEVSVKSSAATATYANKDAGTGKTVTVSGLSLDGAGKDNYVLSSTTAETTGDITKKELGVTPTGTVSKTYDGNADAALTGITYALTGVVGNEDVSLNSSTATGAYANKDAGSSKAITISGLSLQGTATGNYTLAAAIETTGDITKKALTITVEDATKNKGEEDPDFTVSYEGFVAGESKINLNGSLSINRAPGEEVGVYALTASGYSSDNYDITYVDGTLEIISAGAEELAIKAENFFTPNGDGINDEWVVADVETFPSHSLLILDRGGRKVYEAKNYSNDWTGTVEGAFLQEGTYYYIFRFDDPKIAPKKGYITILRK